MRRGDYKHARAFLEESLQIRRELADNSGVADVLSTLGALDLCLGNSIDSRRNQEEALAIRRGHTDKLDIGIALTRLGVVQMHTGDDVAAQESFDESLAMCRGVNAKYGVAQALLAKGLYACRRERPHAAEALLREAADIFREPFNPMGATECAEAFGEMHAGQGTSLAAVRFYAASERQRELLGAPLPTFDPEPQERIIVCLRAALGEQGFDRACAEGRSISIANSLTHELSGEMRVD